MVKNFTILFLICLLFYSTGHTTYNYIVSLGTDCEVAHHLIAYGKKKETLPFDWMRTPTISTLIKLFINNFRGFLEPQYLSVDASAVMIYNNLYNLYFVHDFPTMVANQNLNAEQVENYVYGSVIPNYLDFIPGVKAKYQRRISRLQSILNSRSPVLFIRSRLVSYREIDQLVKFLSAAYKNLEFTLAVVHSDAQIKGKLTMNRVREFYFPKSYTGIQPEWYDKATWGIVFKSLGLI